MYSHLIYIIKKKKKSLPTLYLHYAIAKEDVGALNDRSVSLSMSQCLIPDNQAKLVSVGVEW